MNLRQLARHSFWHYRRSHLAIMAGIAVATAVLLGALIVGDSVRGSLRDLTLERLGKIDTIYAPGQPFRAALADELATELAEENSSERNEVAVAPMWMVPSSISRRVDGKTLRANRVSLYGVDRRFWELDLDQSNDEATDGLLLTPALALDLKVSVGDEVVLRLPAYEPLPADSTLGERIDTTRSYRIPVAAIVPAEGLARFGITASQQAPRNAFIPISLVNDLLEFEQPMANLLAVGNSSSETKVTIQPKLADYGLAIERIESGDKTLWQMESKSLVLPEQVVTAFERAFKKQSITSVVTYLANTIRIGDRSVPYSTVTGSEGLSGVGNLTEEQVVLNRWAADDLQAKVGDMVELTYYEPESTHGVLTEAKPLTLKLTQIAELESEVKGETIATAVADPRLSPRLEGVSDAETISDWDLPFELVEKIRTQDETYWDERTTTPKAFVNEKLARQLWGTRWGSISLLRVADTREASEIEAAILAELDPQALGFAAQPIREQGLAASSGSTPFDVLFLLFSMFLIAAAAMLISLLVRLAIESRSSEVGLLGAMGWNRQAIRKGWNRELLPVVLLGVVLGILVGIAYANLLLFALRTIWIDAIVTPFLELHITPTTLLAGGVGSFLFAMLTLRYAIRKATKIKPRSLLAGQRIEEQSTLTSKQTKVRWGIVSLLVLAAVAIAVVGRELRGEAAAGAFFMAGGLTLVAALVGVQAIFNRPQGSCSRLSLVRVAWSNVVRGGGRSLLSIGLAAAACFMILATSAFRLAPTEAGTGGFQLVAESDQPLFQNLNDPASRIDLGLSAKDEKLLDDWQVHALRVEPGEDASCRNLFQATRPRMLGAQHEFLSKNNFEWAEHAEGYVENPWLALEAKRTDKVTPVVLDFNTAMYAMKLYGGVGSRFTIQDEASQSITLEVVGLLKNSLLQGVAVTSESHLLKIFPSAAGYQFFLAEPNEVVNANQEGLASLALSQMLEDRLGDYGMDAELASDRLAGFLAVQNTYLSTFQALGGLGLLLGAVGLAVVQFRNLAERRGELALLRATGFQRSRLRRLVLLENLMLLGSGLVIGALAASVAVGPVLETTGGQFPWLGVIGLVAGTALVGLLGARFAASRALAAPLTAALRGD